MMVSLEDTYRAFFDCLKQRRWGDLGTFLHPQFTKNDKPYTPDSFSAEPQANVATELELRAVTVDENGLKLASTIVVKWNPSGQVMGMESRKPVVFMEQHFNWFVDGKLKSTVTMPDREEVRRQLYDPESPRRQWEDIAAGIPQSASSANNHNNDNKKLAAMYREYFDCINNRTMGQNWDKFVHAQVTFNGTVLTLDEYRQQVESVITAFPDLEAELHTLIADETAQRVAVQLEFSGTMTKSFAGAKATGSLARFAEHCTYEFSDGKIARLWSVANWGRLGQTTLE